MIYDVLLEEARTKKLEVFEMDLKGNIKGLYKDQIIIIRKDLHNIEKGCTLSEEIGHHETSAGNILDQKDIKNRKQELRARQWAYQRLIPLSEIVRAHKAGVKGRYEIADYLGVTEGFLQSAIVRYKDKFGLMQAWENFIIFFDPLRVIEVVA